MGRPSNSPRNVLRSIRFGQSTNGLIDAGATVGSSAGFNVSFPSGTTTTTFTVRRASSGQATTVPFTVVDECGDWQTLRGGGPAAF